MAARDPTRMPMYRKEKARASQLTILENYLVCVCVVVWRRDVNFWRFCMVLKFIETTWLWTGPLSCFVYEPHESNFGNNSENTPSLKKKSHIEGSLFIFPLLKLNRYLLTFPVMEIVVG
jgi:hypothetical protein